MELQPPARKNSIREPREHQTQGDVRKRAQKVVALLQGSKQADSSNFKSAMQWIIEEEGIGRVKRRRAYVTAFRGASFAIKKSV